MTRKRTIKNPLDLLRLILFYLSGNKSLIDVSQFALMSGIGKISDVGFMKRFVKCKDWIIWLTHHILPNPVIQYKKSEWLKPYQVLAVDASDLVEKGAVKKLWHLHYALDGKFYNIYEDTTKYTDNVFRYSKTGEDGVY